MNDIIYFIILIGIIIFMVFYGGHNYQNKIEYDSSYFNNLSSIILYEEYLQKYDKYIDFELNDYINIDHVVKFCNNIIPNFINCFFIKINPFSYFNINKIISKDNNINSIIMIIFNHNKHNDLELFVNSHDNIGYFYDLNKKISITGIYSIYNNSNEIINITLFILTKPYWHY